MQPRTITDLLAQNDYNKRWDHRILVVDDNESFLRFMASALSGPRVKVFVHDDPYRALEAFSTYHPDLVFLDINMPEIGGLSLLKMLEPINTFNAEIVLLSANANFSRTLHQYVDLERTKFLPKPVSMKHLQSIIDAKRA